LKINLSSPSGMPSPSSSWIESRGDRFGDNNQKVIENNKIKEIETAPMIFFRFEGFAALLSHRVFG
jgi:hypothetical protein